jgi:DNA replication and repair protein RecF
MLDNLQLRNFRCFDALSLEWGPRFNFLIGENGEGKTSILEAVCVLLRLQSQRSATLAPAIQVGARHFVLTGNCDGHLLEFRYGGLHRTLRFDGIEQPTAADYLRLARVVPFSNADIEMIRGGSEARRRYLDFLGLQIEARYRPTLRAYERALRSRNALLKSPLPRPRELAAYDKPLLEHGGALREMRANLIARLTPFITEAYHQIGGGKETADVAFAPGNEPDFASHLARSSAQEQRLRQTVVGPHRDDLELFVDGMPAQSYASEGQQRAFALALKIAQAQIFADEGAAPILLIDDIFGELDLKRRSALLASLPAASQKLVTMTNQQWSAAPGDSMMFRLRDRVLTRE